MQGISLVKISGDEMLLTCAGITLCVAHHPQLREWWRRGYVFYLPQADKQKEYFKKLQEEGYMSVGFGTEPAPLIFSRYTAYVQVGLPDDVDPTAIYAHSLNYTTAALVGTTTPESLRAWLNVRYTPCYELMDEPPPIETYVDVLRMKAR